MQSLFRLLALIDVLDQAFVMEDGAVGSADGAGRFGNPESSAVPAADLVLEAVNDAGRRDFLLEPLPHSGIDINLALNV